MHNFFVVLVLVVVAFTAMAISNKKFKDTTDDDDTLFAMPIYSTSLSRATIRVILDFYAEVSSTLSITRSTVEADGLEQNGFISEVLFHIKSNICITNEEYWSVGEARLRFFNVMFIDGYLAFR